MFDEVPFWDKYPIFKPIIVILTVLIALAVGLFQVFF